ncbi:acyltransferase [Massilia sp. TS11]|uniref:acyltransferase family protein n=1 Tax=Massilia sp. TS11 TaxID=2908003 RepID=UPI001EDB7BCC|nr:acyltransferase [Massilia sp. TS11]MCG2583636.1 acyltransferase [Massilia sp. TS11]
MGLYRLLLAAMVAISHMGISVAGYNPGVVAVISFFLLSGYVMTLLVDKHYRRPGAIGDFYKDRAARLFPQFLFYMGLTTVLVYALGFESIFLNALTPFKVLLNFLMLPQGFFMLWADGALIIPQTWSLGLELCFYLVFPWIHLYASARQRNLLAGLSFLVFLAAYFGKLHSDFFGYRLLPGTLYMFLAGSAFAARDAGSRLYRWAVFGAGVLLFVWAWLHEPLYQTPFNKEVLLGLLIGLGFLAVASGRRFSDLDEFLGNLSYGIFLNHFLVIWLMNKYLGVKEFHAREALLCLGISAVFALGSYFLIERPALAWRRQFRK